MPNCPKSPIATDALDRLVLDVIELERLAGEIATVLEGIDPGTCTNPRIATQLLELLYLAQEAGATIDMAAGRRVSTLIATLGGSSRASRQRTEPMSAPHGAGLRLNAAFSPFAQSESRVWLSRITIRDEDDATVADARGGAGLCRAWDRRPADADRRENTPDTPREPRRQPGSWADQPLVAAMAEGGSGSWPAV